ncbi:hypothetical protein FDN13_12150 [Caloramator sp. E03]|uniref:hypothetical protein n=1 Tax=Caloramator sp. E03 TaxID=2576307 RepID=UPI001110A17E|nr:hypothetical protein [Caloramator sp. E03]QCX34390.1 hypothetical protein FDN13_12150 [Caloramator sp. E03]
MPVNNSFYGKLKIYKDKSKEYKYIIEYPKNKGNITDISMELFKNILEEDDVVIQVDSVLTFLSINDLKEPIKSLKDVLNEKNIYLNYRAYKYEEKKSFLGLMIGNKLAIREVLTFKFSKSFYDDEILKLLLKIGCMIYVPKDKSSDFVDSISNGYYEDENERLNHFKFIMYINSYVDRASVETKISDLEEIKKMFIK